MGRRVVGAEYELKVTGTDYSFGHRVLETGIWLLVLDISRLHQERVSISALHACELEQARIIFVFNATERPALASVQSRPADR